MKRTTLSLVVGVSFLGPPAPARGAEPAKPYHFIREIAIGGEGGWDYLAGEIADTPGVHGFAVAADLGRGFSSNGREAKVSVVDLKTLQTISKVDTGENPDAILYEPARQEVYVFNGGGRSATVFEARSGKVTATTPLGGKPEFAVVDPRAGRIYNNLEDTREVAVIDSKAARWPIAPGEGGSGMAIDLAHHRLFLGCDNKRMLMLDSTNGTVVTSVPIGEGVDANAFDSTTQLGFSANGEGTVTIAREEAPDKLTVVQTLGTARGARTMALDPVTHRIYLAAAQLAPATGAGRPTAVPGAFKVLVYGLD